MEEERRKERKEEGRKENNIMIIICEHRNIDVGRGAGGAFVPTLFPNHVSVQLI